MLINLSEKTVVAILENAEEADWQSEQEIIQEVEFQVLHTKQVAEQQAYKT